MRRATPSRASTGWSVENRLHRVRDVTLGQDACRTRNAVVLKALRLVGIARKQKTLAGLPGPGR